MTLRRLTPTLVLCATGAAVAGGLLALPPADDAGPAAPPPAPGADATVIEIADFSFGDVQSVPAGAVVHVTNADAAAHTLTADGGAFDTGTVDGGSGTTFTAPTAPGPYDFFCGIHPSMTGQLVVD